MKRVMIDIETLSTRKDAAVLSIGLAVFDPLAGIIQTEGWAIAPGKVTGHVDPTTVAWWMQQSDTAREFSFRGGNSPGIILPELHVIIADAEEVWANDPDFDCVILQNWWERTTQSALWPVPRWKNRSCRTVKALAKGMGIDITDGMAAPHNPIEDAVKQAREVIAFLNHLKVA